MELFTKQNRKSHGFFLFGNDPSFQVDFPYRLLSLLEGWDECGMIVDVLPYLEA